MPVIFFFAFYFQFYTQDESGRQALKGIPAKNICMKNIHLIFTGNRFPHGGRPACSFTSLIFSGFLQVYSVNSNSFYL